MLQQDPYSSPWTTPGVLGAASGGRPGFVPTLDSVLCSSLGFRHQDLQWYWLLSWWHELTVVCIVHGEPVAAHGVIDPVFQCPQCRVRLCCVTVTSSCVSRVVPPLPGDGAGISTRFQASKAVISYLP